MALVRDSEFCQEDPGFRLVLKKPPLNIGVYDVQDLEYIGRKTVGACALVSKSCKEVVVSHVVGQLRGARWV